MAAVAIAAIVRRATARRSRGSQTARHCQSPRLLEASVRERYKLGHACAARDAATLSPCCSRGSAGGFQLPRGARAQSPRIVRLVASRPRPHRASRSAMPELSHPTAPLPCGAPRHAAGARNGRKTISTGRLQQATGSPGTAGHFDIRPTAGARHFPRYPCGVDSAVLEPWMTLRLASEGRLNGAQPC
jgi:hypothetical protein